MNRRQVSAAQLRERSKAYRSAANLLTLEIARGGLVDRGGSIALADKLRSKALDADHIADCMIKLDAKQLATPSGLVFAQQRVEADWKEHRGA